MCGTCASLVVSDEPYGLEVVLVGADDVVFAPHAENADRCDGGGRVTSEARWSW